MQGIDYAWGRPGVTAIKNAGAGFVCRYLSHDTTGKNLTRAEASALTAAGLWIVAVFESTADRMLGGHVAGVADAEFAIAQARSCGMPGDRPVYFACDFDATAGQQNVINAYLDGAASVLGRSGVGIYGGYGPVRRALDGGHCTWAWQTYAWSGGKWDGRAQLQQYENDVLIGGVGCDRDRSTTADFGQWKIGTSPMEEDDMARYGEIPAGTAAVAPIALPRGRYTTIGFNCDNGLQGLKPASLRVAVHRTMPDGTARWQVEHHVPVDSAGRQAVVHFTDPSNVDGVSVRHNTTAGISAAGADPAKYDTSGGVTVSYEVS